MAAMLHGGHVACQEQYNIIPMGQNVHSNAKHFYCSCHATWPPCKTSMTHHFRALMTSLPFPSRWLAVILSPDIIIIFIIYYTVEDEDTRKNIIRKDKFVQETGKLLAEFYSNICMQYHKLATRHREERRQLLNSQWRGKKSCFPVKREQKDKVEEQKPGTGKNKRLFLDNTVH